MATSRALTELEGTVLGLVWARQPCTPYRVRREFTDSPSPYWSGSAGAIYPLMARLESAGLLRSAPHATGERGSRRYRLTPGWTARARALGGSAGAGPGGGRAARSAAHAHRQHERAAARAPERAAGRARVAHARAADACRARARSGPVRRRPVRPHEPGRDRDAEDPDRMDPIRGRAARGSGPARPRASAVARSAHRPGSPRAALRRRSTNFRRWSDRTATEHNPDKPGP